MVGGLTITSHFSGLSCRRLPGIGVPHTGKHLGCLFAPGSSGVLGKKQLVGRWDKSPILRSLSMLSAVR